MALLVFLTFMSLIVNQYVPVWMKDSEASHMGAAFASFVLSVSLWFSGNELEGIFVGVWVPSIISLGAFLLPRGMNR